MKFWRVEDAFARKPLVPVTSPVKTEVPLTVKAPPALIAPVLVAFVVVEFEIVRPPENVDDADTITPSVVVGAR